MNLDQTALGAAGLYPAILGKGPLPKFGKNDKTYCQNREKLSTQNMIGSKIHRKNQVIYAKCLSIILTLVIFSHIKVVVVPKRNVFFFFLLFLIGKNRHGIGKKQRLF